MDDLRFGAALRAVRLRRQLRQSDVASLAGVSDGMVSRVERGRLETTNLASIRTIAKALDVRLEVRARWRGGDLDRLLDARHAALGETVTRWLVAVGGWAIRPEVSFSIYGERGLIDLLGWHATSQALLVIELKTEIVDVGELLGTLDRKRRLAGRVAADLGWPAGDVGTALLIAEGRTNRDRVAAHTALFAGALPDRGSTLSAWLRRPRGPVAALAFVRDRRPGTARSSLATVRRVRRRRQARPADP